MMTKVKNVKTPVDIAPVGWALSLTILLISVIKTDSTIDFVLVPRQLFLAAAIIILNLWMPRKEGVGFSYGVLLYLIFWITTFLGHSVAINTVESWAVIARLGLWAGTLITAYRAFRLNLFPISLFSKTMLVVGLIAALTGLPEIAKVLASAKLDVYEVSGLFNHKNFYSSALMLTLPFMVGVFLTEEKGLWRPISIVGLLLATLILFYLRTRGAWLGTFMGIGAMTVILFLQKGKGTRISWYVPAGILALGLFVASYSISQDSVREKIFDARNIDNRITMWDHGLKMFAEYPMTGVGGGNWKIHFPKYGLDPRDVDLNEGIVILQRPHNDFIWTLSEFGIPGGLAYLVFFAYLGFLIFRMSRSDDPSIRRFLPVITFALVAYLGYSLGEFPMERPFHSTVLLFIAGWILANGEQRILKSPSIWILPGIAIVLSIFNLWVNSDRFNGEKHAKKMLEYNALQQAPPMIREADASMGPFFNMDNFANPIMYFKGMGILAQQKIEPSRGVFESALEIHPWHIPSLTQLGNTYKYQKDYNTALEYYDNILAFAPSNRTVRVNKAEVLIYMKRYEEAVPVLFFMTYPEGKPNPKYLQMVSQVATWMYQSPVQKGLTGWIQKKLKRVQTPSPKSLTEEFIEIQKSAQPR